MVGTTWHIMFEHLDVTVVSSHGVRLYTAGDSSCFNRDIEIFGIIGRS